MRNQMKREHYMWPMLARICTKYQILQEKNAKYSLLDFVVQIRWIVCWSTNKTINLHNYTYHSPVHRRTKDNLQLYHITQIYLYMFSWQTAFVFDRCIVHNNLPNNIFALNAEAKHHFAQQIDTTFILIFGVMIWQVLIKRVLH